MGSCSLGVCSFGVLEFGVLEFGAWSLVATFASHRIISYQIMTCHVRQQLQLLLVLAQSICAYVRSIRRVDPFKSAMSIRRPRGGHSQGPHADVSSGEDSSIAWDPEDDDDDDDPSTCDEEDHDHDDKRAATATPAPAMKEDNAAMKAMKAATATPAPAMKEDSKAAMKA